MSPKSAERTIGAALALSLILVTLMPNGCMESAENAGLIEYGQAQKIREAVEDMVKGILDTEAEPKLDPEIKPEKPKPEHSPKHRGPRPLRYNTGQKLSINFEPMVDTTVPDFSLHSLKVKI